MVTTPTQDGTGVRAVGRARIAARTLRGDRWWLTPLAYGLTLLIVGVYLAYAVFVNKDYYWKPYISPMYSPCLTGNCVADSGWGWFPSINPVTPALIIIIFPAGLRATCYYYRKAYYRSFFLSPPACAVPEAAKHYRGESRFPLIVQNIHRYFFYITLIFNCILTYDAVIAFRDHQGHWGHAGLGTLVMVVNAILLWGYNASCHTCRHAIGGRLRHFSKHPVRYWLWSRATALNARHGQIAWASLVFVAITDLYIRLVAGGAFNDPRFF
ncbi:hypothetical protein [Flexivirga alba]|jgi:hypothetical protein|uniref:Succinate dehydrogenase n=1 Tax=Flexivirga alba TaxID=702742 RepID=A0ABW2AMZ7_9MICO